MSSTLNPYLTFQNNAREAMEFYKSVLGGELNINTFGEFGAEQLDPNGVMHAQLETPAGFRLMASDNGSQGELTMGDNVTISIAGDDADDLRRWFNALAEGGQVTMPLEKQVWGDEFGMLTDQFGVHWMVNISSAD